MGKRARDHRPIQRRSLEVGDEVSHFQLPRASLALDFMLSCGKDAVCFLSSELGASFPGCPGVMIGGGEAISSANVHDGLLFEKRATPG